MNGRSFRQFLSFALMAMFFFVLFYVNTDLLYKIFMAALVFALVFLLSLGDEVIKQVENRRF